jgi:hypothetical protein
MTITELRGYNYRELSQIAKHNGVAGWHAMRKEELVRAIAKKVPAPERLGGKKSGLRHHNNKSGKPTSEAKGNGYKSSRLNAARVKSRQRLQQLQAKLQEFKDLSARQPEAAGRVSRDRLVVLVRDPYWLHAWWELSERSIERSRSALGQKWHQAQPALQLYRIDEDGAAAFERKIPIHGGVNNWYIDVQDPPASYQMEIGYALESENFYTLAKSNTVLTPTPGSRQVIDKNWSDIAENADRIYAMSGGYSTHGASSELQELLEERLHRPMGTPVETRYGDGATRLLFQPDDLQCAIDAELVVYGATHPHAHLTVQGEPVQMRPNGTFVVRISLPDRRQIIPIVASSPDGAEQQTIILGIERNTKVMETMHRDPTKAPVAR